MSNDSLKPWENKKGQTFVRMLVFYMSFFAAGCWLKSKKDMQKPSITTKIRSFLVCQSFTTKSTFADLSFKNFYGNKRSIIQREQSGKLPSSTILCTIYTQYGPIKNGCRMKWKHMVIVKVYAFISFCILSLGVIQ